MHDFLFADGPNWWQNSWLLGGLIVGGLVLLVLLLACARFLRWWIQSQLAGAGIGFFALIRMELLKLDPGLIVREKIRLVQAGIKEVSTEELEAHVLAKGDVTRVALALIAARKAGTALSWRTAADRDLSGEDPAALVPPRVPELRDRFGRVVARLQPAGAVDFGDRCVEALADGADVEAGAWVRCVGVKEGRVLVRPTE
jgi:membrane-bound ClpP family serine protease